MIRIAAVHRKIAAWPERTHVLFMGEGNKITGFYMDRDTYTSIPFDVEATPWNYLHHGRLIQAPAGFMYVRAR
jgi:hypothetical protein